MCNVLVCVGLLITVGLLVWILVKQHDCCKNESYGGVGGIIKTICKHPCTNNAQGLCVDSQGDFCTSSMTVDGHKVGNLCGSGEYSTASFNCKPL